MTRAGSRAIASVRRAMLLFDTALGTCGIDWSEVGITRVTLPGMPGRDTAARPIPEAIRDAVAGIVALLAGESRDLLECALDDGQLSDFDRRVYTATRAVRPGLTASYGEIARAIAEPDRARIVGAALGRNPFPIIVPCHRILAADGALHGFSAPGGIATKRRMLEIEGAPGFAQETLFA
jgi:methylated-DNA-[protein]-cysteine S-methyltransferase